MITVLLGIGGAASALLAVAALLKVLGIDKGWKRFGLFLADWFGEDARPGHDAVPSFPERMKHLEDSHGEMDRQVRQDLGKIKQSLSAREQQSLATMAKLDALSGRTGDLDKRIADHRDRNTQQIAVLQAAVDTVLTRMDQAGQRLDRIEAHTEQRRARDREDNPEAPPPG